MSDLDSLQSTRDAFDSVKCVVVCIGFNTSMRQATITDKSKLECIF